MKKLIFLALLLTFLPGCRTTEANYRAAYEKAKAHRENWDGIDGTIYDAIRRESKSSTIDVEGRQIPAMTARVKVVDSDDRPADRYIIVAQFKQLFNARSLCRRLQQNGYPEATLLVTAEPLYYVAAAPCFTDGEVVATYDAMKNASPVSLSEPYPLLLKTVK